MKKKRLIPFVMAAGLLLCSCSSQGAKRSIVHTENAPSAIGPYEQAIIIDNMVYTSGQIGLDPKTNTLVSGGIENETKQVLDNIGAVLTAANTSFNHVIKANIYLTDLNNFTIVNDIYASYFKDGNYPARSCVEISALPKGALIEIETIAYIN